MYYYDLEVYYRPREDQLVGFPVTLIALFRVDTDLGLTELS